MHYILHPISTIQSLLNYYMDCQEYLSFGSEVIAVEGFVKDRDLIIAYVNYEDKTIQDGIIMEVKELVNLSKNFDFQGLVDDKEGHNGDLIDNVQLIGFDEFVKKCNEIFSLNRIAIDKSAKLEELPMALESIEKTLSRMLLKTTPPVEMVAAIDVMKGDPDLNQVTCPLRCDI